MDWKEKLGKRKRHSTFKTDEERQAATKESKRRSYLKKKAEK